MNRQLLDRIFAEKNIDCIVSSAPQTRLWYSNVQTTDGYIIIERDKAYLFVDSRYIEYCEKYAQNVEVRLLAGKSLKEFFDQKAYKKVAFEKDYIVYDEFDRLLKLINPKTVAFIKGQELRIKKSEAEIKAMEEVISISLKAYEKLVDWIIPGMTEKQIATKLNHLMKTYGAQKESFDEIVASGPNSAEPHHHPTDRRIKSGELLKIDFGALYNGFCADITRTFILGRQNISDKPEQEKILEIVKEAARLGREAVKPGVKASDIDKICRDYIQKQGYGSYFVHSTGHGLGIDVHELPNVSSHSDYVLEEGMIITVEPGIYIPGLGGARIEDDVLVTADGHRVLTRPEEEAM